MIAAILTALALFFFGIPLATWAVCALATLLGRLVMAVLP